MAAPVESNSDAHIQNEIQRLLTSSSQLRSQPIVVEVANGIVTLSGSVNDAVALAARRELRVQRLWRASRLQHPARSRGAPAAAAAARLRPRPRPRPRTPRGARPATTAKRDREATRELMEKAKREMEAGNTAAAVAACQEVLRIDPNHPHAPRLRRAAEAAAEALPRRQ